MSTAVEAGRVSGSVVDHDIETWRRARLGSEAHVFGWPPESLLWRIVDLGLQAIASLRCAVRMSTVPQTMIPVEMDAVRVQAIVDRMPDEMRAAFEAYHLGIVRGDSCRDKPHKYRANLLAISESTYYRRKDAGREFVGRYLDRDSKSR
jgi:hypothetical protein